jgi:hypothetical protein
LALNKVAVQAEIEELAVTRREREREKERERERERERMREKGREISSQFALFTPA